jgi:ribosomal protein S12 methylthiotransferase accessory factor YcaO
MPRQDPARFGGHNTELRGLGGGSRELQGWSLLLSWKDLSLQATMRRFRSQLLALAITRASNSTWRLRRRNPNFTSRQHDRQLCFWAWRGSRAR